MNKFVHNIDRLKTGETDSPASPESSADRREHSRHLTVMRVARLANQEIEGLGVVRNVSEGGMMIEAHVEVDIGDGLTISLLEDQQVAGKVVWKREGLIGVAFDDSVSVDEVLARPVLQGDGKRTRLPRLTVEREALVHVGDRKIPAMIVDVSQRGAKLHSTSRFHVNDQILIALADCRHVRGTVKWHSGETVGIEFHRLLGVDELVQWLPKDQG